MRFLIVLVLGMAMSMSARALTIGVMNANSKYGEPFNVEVELYNIYGLTYKDISYRIVPKKEHGVSKTTEDLFPDIKFGFYASNGIGWISITSEKIITNQSVDFILEVSWPTGRSMRRYQVNILGKPFDPRVKNECPYKGKLISCAD